ncbi:MAG: hypothetical protein BAJATHORv1_10387 [Candidatus Thorarchaeota archaeon]|nr:MAG: hypothetical protein BAJATHORv1_10387 [Candidatus Thorarchaeota archaeon]
MPSINDMLEKARDILKIGNALDGAKLLEKAADILASKGELAEASKIYEETGLAYSKLYRAEEAFQAFQNATLMLIRMNSSPAVHREIVRINREAAKIAEQATEYKQAAEFYFRAADFGETEKQKNALTLKAADALEELADIREVDRDYEATINLLKKVGRLYYKCGDDELGERINDRAIRIAMKWVDVAKEENDYLSAGNALAEAAQILQTKGDMIEATRLMMESGEYYEAAELYEKAGNIFDAAQEAYRLERLTSARKKAMLKAAEAYMKMEGKPAVLAPLLIKAGELFKDLGRVMKAKWAFKKAGELFEQLSEKAKDENELASEKSYLRHMAFCLNGWGQDEEADRIYQQVVDYYLEQAEKEREKEHFEEEAVSLEEASAVLREAGKEEEAKQHFEEAMKIYVKLAEEVAEQGQNDEASKYYNKAATCAEYLGDQEKHQEYHTIASKKALEAAQFYEELEVPELATIWLRAAGVEAMLTNDPKKITEAIQYLEKSAEGFIEINEPREAFEDLYLVFTSVYEHGIGDGDTLARIVKKMDDIVKKYDYEKEAAILEVVLALEKRSGVAALLSLQEREEELVEEAPTLRRLVDIAKEKK